MTAEWNSPHKLISRNFYCGHCCNLVASDRGYSASGYLDGYDAAIFICPHCSKPTFFHGLKQLPDAKPGNEVRYVPEGVYDLYTEARDCVASSSYTASVLICRKLLMNIAVAQGAEPNLKFIQYVNFLQENGFVPPNGREWVDHIRQKGNEATHEIVLMDRSDAIDLISFSEMLLKFIYEFPGRVPSQDI